MPQSRGHLPVGYAPIWPGGVPEARRETPGVTAPSVTEPARGYGEHRELAATKAPAPGSVRSGSHVSAPRATPHTASLPPGPRGPARAEGAGAPFNDPRLGGFCKERERSHRSLEFEQGLAGQTQGAGWFLPGLQGRVCSLPFPASGGARTPRLMAPSSVFKARSPTPSLAL